MEIGGWVILAVLWALLNLMTKGKQKKQAERRREPRTAPRPVSTPLPHSPDATQQEGSRLELVLRQFERALDEGAPFERPTTLSLPEEEEVEERTSLEAEPEVISLETGVRREVRQRVDRDEEAEEIDARRISAAAARDHATTKVDHAAFDKRIRQEPADKTATRHTARQLRDAMVWREILGRPVSLREDS